MLSEVEAWDEGRLEAFIDGGVGESATVEYKAAASLSRQNNARDEITKDVSSFANAAGGIVIYGIREFREREKRHLPQELDPIERLDFPREWLEQMIAQIQPRIANIRITAVELSSSPQHVAYVVEIPQGTTAHQSTDGRYYRRYNFQVLRMLDHEINDVRNRAKHPNVNAEIFIQVPFLAEETKIRVRIHNDSDVIARHVAAVIQLPHNKINGFYFFPENSMTTHTDGLKCIQFRVRNGFNAPLFPGDTLIIPHSSRRYAEMQPEPKEPSIADIRITLFADEMKKRELRKDLQAAFKSWT